LELGYFVAALTADNVTILLDETVEIPSHFLGVGYYRLDSAGKWKKKIKAELRRAGIIQ